MKICLLEDDQTLAYGIRRFLQEEGHCVSHFSIVQDALSSTDSFDLYLVDIALPDETGFYFVSKIRLETSAPVIYLTAKDDETSLLKGFETGADDYITKPFSLNELKSRMSAIMRRMVAHQYTYGELVIDVDAATVKHMDQEIHLSVQEYRILLLFMRNPKDLVTRQMVNEIMGIVDDNTQDNTVNVAIRRLRNKLDGYLVIKTVHNQGYILGL